MREKPVLESAVQRTTDFLTMLYLKCKGEDYLKDTTTMMQNDASVSKSTFAACKDLEIVKVDKNGMAWNTTEPNRLMAVSILNHLLEKRKKVKHVPIPELNEFYGGIKALTEKLDTYITQNQNLVKRAYSKSVDLPVSIAGETLFSEADQYHKDFVYLAGQIASNLYTYDTTNMLSRQSIQSANDEVIFATQDLLNKINNLKTTKNGQQ